MADRLRLDRVNPEQPVTLQELLEQSDWLRRLARALTNEHEAEDVVQETWVNVLRRRPCAVRDVRAWLATVARHVMRSAGRAGRARQRRERLSALGAPPADPAELAARVSLERRVSGIVLDLDPVYRDAILLRFWEDLAPSAIADRLGLPLDTVRTRLRRGLSRVRETLDRGGGGHDDWF